MEKAELDLLHEESVYERLEMRLSFWVTDDEHFRITVLPVSGSRFLGQWAANWSHQTLRCCRSNQSIASPTKAISSVGEIEAVETGLRKNLESSLSDLQHVPLISSYLQGTK